MKAKTGVLLVNLGTPQSPRPKDVHKYLVEFLTDERVMDVPWLQRQLLVRGIIVPRRCKTVAATYQSIWTPEGSPLLTYGIQVQRLLQEKLGDSFHVSLAMRYQTPSIPDVLKELEKMHLKELIILPLFPHYTSATTGSIHQKVMEQLKKWNTLPELRFINSYPTHPLLVKSFSENARAFNLSHYDHFLFSFHGLPERQIKKADKSGTCLNSKICCKQINSDNKHCYAAQCHATAQAISNHLQLPLEHTSLCYQSRLGRNPWLQPYATDTLTQLAKLGIKKLLVFSPAFVADCLETLYEIKVEYSHLFKKQGGEQLDLVPSLNTNLTWIQTLEDLVLKK